MSALYKNYARSDIAFEKGRGVRLFTKDGEDYFDFAGGIAVNILGHADPHVVDALKGQAGKLWHVGNVFTIPEQEKLAQRLTDVSFADMVFFTNSGAEAVETAIKTARRCQFVQGHEERYEILTCKGAFHGRTIATVNAGGNPKYMEGFGPVMPGFTNLPFGDLDAIKEAINENTAGILLEPVQGEGGVRPLSVQFLKDVRALCDEHGLLLIYDEVQCGAGRTGKLFAHQWADGAADPDVMAVAKGMGGGFPMGACLATERAAAGMVIGTHGSTYGGGPLAMAVGNAVFDELTDPALLANVVKVGNYLSQQFAALKDAHPDVVKDVRGKGLLCGMKLKKKALDVRNLARDNHLLVGNAGDNVLRMVPPLILTQEHVRQAIEILDKVFTEAKAMDDFDA